MLEGAKSIGAGAAKIALAGAAIGIGNVFSSLIHSVARNPSLAKQLFGYAIQRWLFYCILTYSILSSLGIALINIGGLFPSLVPLLSSLFIPLYMVPVTPSLELGQFEVAAESSASAPALVIPSPEISQGESFASAEEAAPPQQPSKEDAEARLRSLLEEHTKIAPKFTFLESAKAKLKISTSDPERLYKLTQAMEAYKQLLPGAPGREIVKHLEATMKEWDAHR